jgi:midasin
MRYLQKFISSSSYPHFIQWNPSFVRMCALAHKALSNNEPALLVGPAGIGKTTLTQLLAHTLGTQHYSIVAHQYIEVSDFVGALRPVRNTDSGSIFQWEDGPLLKCILGGGVFLIDEINMAPESVLEGLNSVLEMPPSLTVNEKMHVAPEGPFVIIAAMNPSGDWGKKELTPALRSRFTEIYAENPLNSDPQDLNTIMGQLMDESVETINKLTSIFYTYNRTLR